MLWYKCKKLHSLSKIQSFFISGDIIKIKVNENSSPLLITHVDDFSKHFFYVDISPPLRPINICLCCVFNYLVILVNYTDFFVFFLAV